MQQSVAEIEVALRVLLAITRREHPDPQDVEELSRIAPPIEYKSIDELAYAIIRRALDRFKQARSAHA